MKHISVKIPEKMHQDLEAAAETNYFKFSDIVRKFTRIGLKSFSIQPQGETQLQQDKFLLMNGARYAISTYCLITEYIEKEGSEDINIQFKAEKKLQKIIAEIYQDSIKKELV